MYIIYIYIYIYTEKLPSLWSFLAGPSCIHDISFSQCERWCRRRFCKGGRDVEANCYGWSKQAVIRGSDSHW